MNRLLDAEIIRCLKQNSRMSITQLAAIVGGSRATVKARMEELERRGTIRQYTIVTNQDAAGQAGQERVFFIIKFTQQGDIAQLKPLCQTHHHIRGVWGVTGVWDCFILVSAPSLAAITDLRQTLQQTADIERIETAAVLDNLLTV